MRLIVIVGARPSVVKIAPLLPQLSRAGITTDIAFTGSRSVVHPEDEGNKVGFYGVELPPPRWFLDIGAGTDAVTTGRAMVVFEDLFAAETPDAVAVVGEVNATLAAAISAAKAGLPVVHIDAGMRCGDLSVPEEVNRVLISRVAAVHLTPTERALENLEDEGIEPERIHFVGSLMAESVLEHLDAIRRFRTCVEMGLTERGYVLGSFHLPENLADKSRLRGILSGLAESPLPVLIPDANGLRASIEGFGLAAHSPVHLVDPVPYTQMLSLERDAAAIVTDSGGVQVEACMMCVPCVTVRECTEFATTVAIGANRLADASVASIRAAMNEAMNRRPSWTPPKRWDRAVSDRITRILKRGIEPLS